MWQQMDCAAGAAKAANPSGCRSDLFPWVETTIGAGSNGKAQPAGFNAMTTGEGSTSMGFYNMQAGDAPYLKQLADEYTTSDNFHQGVNGGTGANHVMLGAGDAIWFSDGAGHAAVPPNYGVNPTSPGTPLVGAASALSEIENPNPQPGTNNYYIEDGYGGGSGSPTATAPNANYGGGSYSNCSDPAQPGVGAIRDYLSAVKVDARCETGHYYLLNNYNPGYFGDGSNAYADTNAKNYVFTIPPSSLRTIGDALSEKRISWAYYWRPVQSLSRRQVPAEPGGRVLQHLQLGAVLDLDHDQSCGAGRAPEGHDRPLRRHRQRRTAGGVLREAERNRRRSPSVVEAQSL